MTLCRRFRRIEMYTFYKLLLNFEMQALNDNFNKDVKIIWKLILE
jgi:hypothetical protein